MFRVKYLLVLVLFAAPLLIWSKGFWAGIIYTKFLLWGCWALFITRWFLNFFKNGAKAVQEPDMPLMSTVPCASRYDAVEWPKLKIILAGIFVLPGRLVGVFGGIFGGGLVSILNSKINGTGDTSDEQTERFWFWQRLGLYCIARPVIFCAGFTSFNRRKHKVSDFLPGYEKYEEKMANVRAPIKICNHVTIIDVFFHLVHFQDTPCFLAMESVANFPIVGFVAKVIQTVFTKRGDEASKAWTLDRITERCKWVLEGKNFPPMLIYPEGGINNGKDLMNFKRGAFGDEVPLKIFMVETWALKGGQEPSWNLLGELETLILLLTGYYGITIHEFDNFDPLYSVEKRGLKPGHEDNWK
jgi:hypothetical protein